MSKDIKVLTPLVADCVCCVKSGEVLGRDGDAATATALKAIQDVESEEREAARLREQKIAQKASFNEEYDTGERNDSTRALIYMQQLSTPYLGSTLCAVRSCNFLHRDRENLHNRINTENCAAALALSHDVCFSGGGVNA